MNLVHGASTLPGRCFLCERAYDDGEQAANVGQVYEPEFPCRLYGTKTVCVNCAKAVGQAHGLVVQTEGEFVAHMEPIFAARDEAIAERDVLQAQVDEGVAGILKLVERTKRAASKTNAG